MCLLAFAYKTQTDSPLIVTSNRDEFYPRPTLPMHWWPDAPILAGKDLNAGGTWLGLSRNGRFAAVTNYRYLDENGEMESQPLSRGQLVTDFLVSELAASDWASAIEPTASEYGGFNLLLYDGSLFQIKGLLQYIRWKMQIVLKMHYSNSAKMLEYLKQW